MKIKYEFDIKLVRSIFRDFGLAVMLGGLFYGTLQDGNLAKTWLLLGTGFAFTLISTLKEKEDD